jgi:hypothetical protein
MATNAERQAAFRQRRDARIRELEALRNRDDGEEIAKLKRELAHVEHTLALAMGAIKMLKAQNKRLRNGEPFEIIVPAVAEEPPKAAALTWGENGVGDPEAVTPAGGEYCIVPHRGRGFATFFTPPKGPRGGRKETQGVGNFETLAEAKAACEKHARAVT